MTTDADGSQEEVGSTVERGLPSGLLCGVLPRLTSELPHGAPGAGEQGQGRLPGRGTESLRATGSW